MFSADEGEDEGGIGVSKTTISGLITDNELTGAERLVGLFVYFMAESITVAHIRSNLTLSEKKVLQALGKLVERGYLIRTRSHNGWEISPELENDVESQNGKIFRNSGTNDSNSCKIVSNSGTNDRNSGKIFRNDPSAKEEREEKRTKREDKEEYYKDISDEMSLSDSYESDVKDALAYNSSFGDMILKTEDTDNVKTIRDCPYQEILKLFNEICISYPRVRGLGGNRRKLMGGRWREFPDLGVFRTVFENAESSSFMKGQGNRGWAADFDWMIRPSNFQKILEGKYLDKEGAASANKQGGDPFLEYMDRVIRGEV